MIDKTLKRLEFDKLLSKISVFMPSEGSKKFLDKVEFARDVNELRERQDVLSDASKVILSYSPVPTDTVTDIEEAVNRASIGGVLSCEELYEIKKNLSSFTSLKRHFNAIEDSHEKYPHINEIYYSLFTYDFIIKKISKSISDDYEVLDSASTELKRIRRQIQNKEKEIRNTLSSFLKDKSTSIYLQESFVTMRKDRFVLPVKTNNRSKIKGAVLDKSKGGSTLFIEPLSVMEKNNEIISLYNDEAREIHKILSELSKLISEENEKIKMSIVACDELYYYYGIGNFMLATNSTIPKLSSKVKLINSRHPLLEAKTVVPMTLTFGEENRALIITGPNTGGKTVCLKTIGLLSLMHQMGLAIPASESSELPFFEDIFADIGDEQSIEQSLSTFSSHIVNIIEILENADENSLILLDELGAGTDPEEGSAIAKAVLDELVSRKSLIFATSHYASIKRHAMNEDKYQNASVSFDLNLLKPTYKLLMGVPGSSNALSIAKRLGMPEKILHKADINLDSKNADLEKLIFEAEIKREEAEENLEKSRIVLRESSERLEKLEKRDESIKNKRESIINDANIEANRIVNEAKEEAKKLMNELRSLKDNVDYKKMESLYRDYRQSNIEKNEVKQKKKTNTNLKLKIGDTVYIPKINNKGTVISEVDKKGNFKTRVGIMNMYLNLADVEYAEKKEETSSYHKKGELNLRFSSNKLDIRGMNTLEAKPKIDIFIDSAILSNSKRLEIVHGKGTGVLGKFVHSELKKNKHIESYHYGNHFEGGTGVTIVNLK